MKDYNFNNLRSFEGLSNEETYEELNEIAQSNLKLLKKSNGRVLNNTYLTSDGLFTLTFTKSRRNGKIALCLLDYEEYILNYQNKNIIIKDRQGRGQNIPSISSNGAIIPVHKLTTESVGMDGKEVDHINHCKFDCTKENLRICTTDQNHMNRRNSMNTRLVDDYYIYINYNLEISDDDLKDIQSKGFKVRMIDYYYIIRKQCSKDNYYEDVNYIESLLYGDYRFNPLNWFEETWHALMLYRMGLITKKELDDYQYDYISRNYSAMIPYYNL